MKRFVYICAYCHKPKKTPATKFFMCCGIAQPCKTAQQGVVYTRKQEYAIWGTKNGVEDVIKINGQEVQKSLSVAKKIKAILEKRGEFQNVRIQELDMNNLDFSAEFVGAMKQKTNKKSVNIEPETLEAF